MKRHLPVLTLALLSPFVAEILLGATPVSRVASLLPLICLYGGGSVLIRALARRMGPGWDRIVCLAAAYALVEEGLVMQTMFSPDLFDAAACGGRVLGVNWVWTEALVGYHVVWSIVIPIALVEICFPQRRDQPWLGRTGTILALVVYALGAVAIAVAFRRFLTPHFRASYALWITTGVGAANLVAWALRPPAPPWPAARAGLTGDQAKEWTGTTVSPISAGLLALAAAGIWIQLFHLPQALRSGPRVLLPIILAAGLAWGTSVLLRRWSAPGRNWTDSHRLAVVTGALLASMIYGVSVIKAGTPFDRGAQALSCVATLVWLGALAWRRRHGAPRTESREFSYTKVQA